MGWVQQFIKEGIAQMASVSTTIETNTGYDNPEPHRNIVVSSIKLTNLLSFGPDSEAIELQPLNILIGPNAVGKSNLIDALALLKAAAHRSLAEFLGQRGGVGQWLWQGNTETTASIEVTLPYPGGQSQLGDTALRYNISFTQGNEHELRMVAHWLDGASAPAGRTIPIRYVDYIKIESEADFKPSSRGSLAISADKLAMLMKGAATDRYVSDLLGSFVFYRNWNFSRDPLAPARVARSTDIPDRFLAEDGGNLAAVLRYISQQGMKDELKRYLRKFDKYARDFDVKEVGNPTILQLTLQDRGFVVDASRFSDGTMHWLALLAVLLNPTPPQLVCLEEPEVGLHPDMIPTLAELLRGAAERSQLIVTTQSADLINNFTDWPEAVLVCDRNEEGTQIRRLKREQLAPWLEKYKLDDLWSMGQIGGNRF